MLYIIERCCSKTNLICKYHQQAIITLVQISTVKLPNFENLVLKQQWDKHFSIQDCYKGKTTAFSHKINSIALVNIISGHFVWQFRVRIFEVYAFWWKAPKWYQRNFFCSINGRISRKKLYFSNTTVNN